MQAESSERGAGLSRNIGFWGASAIMVGIIIGSGIFRTPPAIAKEVSEPWLIVGMWGVGGVISLLGALTYAELAVMYPQAGGVYVFLREGYGRGMAFVFGWTYLLISKPAAAAGIALLFGETVREMVNLDGLLGCSAKAADQWATTGLLAGLTVVNVLGNRVGSGVAVVLTALKFGALAAIVAMGAWTYGMSALELESGRAAARPMALALVSVMSSVLWTYDGWSDVGAIAGEVRNPNRMLPRVYVAGTLAVTVMYVAVNIIYMKAVPLEEMRMLGEGGAEAAGGGTANAGIAPTVAERLMGSTGLVVALVILVSTAGSTHGSIITGARISYAQARDGLLFSALGQVSRRYHTPVVSLWVQLVLSVAALWLLGDFKRLIDSFVFTMWIFYGLAGASIFLLRARKPGAARAYRCWGYPVTPGIFVLSAAAMTVLSVIEDNTAEDTGHSTLIWLGVLAAGVPVYWMYRRWGAKLDSPV